MNLEEKMKILKRSRFPDSMGDFSTVFRNVAMRGNSQTGKELKIIHDGIFGEGYRTGAADVALSGADKLLFTKDKPGVYPITNMDSIYESSITAPYVEKFLYKDLVDNVIPKNEKKHATLLKELERYNDRKIDYYQKNLSNIELNNVLTPSKENLKLKDYQKNMITYYQETKSLDIVNEYINDERRALLQDINDSASQLDVLMNNKKKINNMDTIYSLNKTKIEKLVIENIVPSKKLSDQLNVRYSLAQDIEDYKILQTIYDSEENLYKLQEEANDINIGTKNYSKTELKSLFSKFKSRDIAVFQSDDFGIYDFDQIRKELNPNSAKSLESFQERADKLSSRQNVVLLKNISDHRTKLANNQYDPINFVHTIDNVVSKKSKKKDNLLVSK